MTVTQASKVVGWPSRSRASEAFRRSLGIRPEQYRTFAQGAKFGTVVPDSDTSEGRSAWPRPPPVTQDGVHRQAHPRI